MRLFSLFFLLGTLIIQFMDSIPPCSLILILFLFSMLMWLVSHLWLKHKAFNITLFSAISAVLFGLLLSSYQANTLLKHGLSAELEGKELLITGVVRGIPNKQDNGTRFLFDVQRAIVFESSDQLKSTMNSLDLGVLQLKGLIRLGWYQQAEPINAGELWQLKVKLKRPSGFMNPGGFDYERWLFSEKIVATGYVRQSQTKIENRILKEKRHLNDLIQSKIDGLRQKIHENIQANVSDKSSAAMLSALLVAVRDDLSEDQWELLRSTGTSHLVAISGLHIAVVASFAFYPIMLLWRRFPHLNERIPLTIAGALMGTVFAFLYALLAGFTLPTQRAFLIVSVVLWGLVSRRSFHASTTLSMVLIAVLFWNPLAALSASFWLSFLAVCLILFFINRQKTKPKWVFVKLQLFLSLSMLPLTLLLFGNASLTSPVANLIAIPWVSLFIVPVSLLGLLFMPISSVISGLLFQFSSFGIEIFFKGLAFLDQSSFSSISFSGIPSVLLLMALLGFLCLFLPKGFPARWLGVLLMIPAFFYQPEKPNYGEFKYTLLDVGQGYASVLETENYVLVYDAGVRVSERFDLGKLVVGPYLQYRGIEAIDKMIISHEDIDHRGGADYLIRKFTVDEVMISDTNAIKNSQACIQGQQWQWDGVNFEIVFPYENYEGNDNNRSCVLKIWNQHHALLLTGDIQKQAEQALLASIPEKIDVDVFSVPHHGSKTSSTVSFIQQVSPKIGLVSAGYRSRFGHPHSDIVKRYQRLDVTLLDTVSYGAITLTFPKDDSLIGHEYYRLENRGFWSR